MAEPTELVQVIKQESTAGGGDSADERVYEQPIDDFEDLLSATGLGFQEPGGGPSRTQTVKVWRDGGIMRFKDTATTEKSLADLAASAAGISAATHRTLDQLVHEIAENSFDEPTYTGSRADTLVTWTDSGKTQKIREELYTYTGSKVTTIVTKQYDGAGALITGETMTETIAYTGNTVSNITRAMS
jgi:hypothetical protein